MHRLEPPEAAPSPFPSEAERTAGVTSPERRARPPRTTPSLGFTSPEEAVRARRAFHALSDREAGVLTRLAFGYSAKEVAKQLGLSCRTVDTFRTRALLKLRARNTVDAVRLLTVLSMLDHGDDTDGETAAAGVDDQQL